MIRSTDLARLEIGWCGYSWLDKHIIEQANHYGMSPEKHAALVKDAATFDEVITREGIEEAIVKETTWT